MQFCYADPPYFGRCCYYGHQHGDRLRPFDGRCWDDIETHRLLIQWLVDEYPDGWALSASAPSLRQLLPFAPLDVRPAYAWEPVLFASRANPPHIAHPPPQKGGKQTTPKDFFSGRITLQKGLTGAKSPEFCQWVLQLLNAKPEDAIADPFPGAGGMRRAIADLGAALIF